MFTDGQRGSRTSLPSNRQLGCRFQGLLAHEGLLHDTQPYRVYVVQDYQCGNRTGRLVERTIQRAPAAQPPIETGRAGEEST